MKGRKAFDRLTKSEFVRHGLLVFVSAMLVNGSNYAFHVLLSRRLGVDAYGELSSLIAILTIGSSLGVIGNIVMVKLVAESYAVRNMSNVAGLRKLALQGALIVVSVCAILAISATRPIAAYLHLFDALAVSLMCISLGCGTILPALRGVLQGTQNFAGYALSTVIEALGKVALGIAAVYAGFGVVGAFAAILAASLMSLVYTILASRTHEQYGKQKLNLDARRLWQTVSAVSAATVATAVLTSSDVILVKHFFNSRDAGLYSIVAVVGKMLFFVVGFIPTLVLPKASERAAAGEPAAQLLLQAAVCTMGLSAICLALFFAASRAIVLALAGPAFVGAAPFVGTYGLAMALLSATSLSVAFRIGIHRFGFVAPLGAVAALEIAAISLFHSSLSAVIADVTCANFIALVVLAIGILPPRHALVTAAVAS